MESPEPYSDQLIPRSPEQNADLIRRTLLNEREMRKRVFEDNPTKRRQKLLEIDESLRALECLERACDQGRW